MFMRMNSFDEYLYLHDKIDPEFCVVVFYGHIKKYR